MLHFGGQAEPQQLPGTESRRRLVRHVQALCFPYTVTDLQQGVVALRQGISTFLRGRKSVIFEVWAAPVALETLQKGGGLRPPPF